MDVVTAVIKAIPVALATAVVAVRGLAIALAYKLALPAQLYVDFRHLHTKHGHPLGRRNIARPDVGAPGVAVGAVMTALGPGVGQAGKHPLAVVVALDLRATNGQAVQVAVVGQGQQVAAVIADAAAILGLRLTGDGAKLEDLVADAMTEQRCAHLQVVALADQVRQTDHRPAAHAAHLFCIQIPAAAAERGAALHFVLLIQHRRTPGFGVIDKQAQVRVDPPEHRQARRPAGVGHRTIIVIHIRVVVAHRQVALAAVGHMVVAQRRGNGDIAEGDRILQEQAAGFLLTGRHELRLIPAEVVVRVAVKGRQVHQHVTGVQPPLDTGGQLVGQRAAVEQAGVAHLKHLVAVLGVDVLAAGRGAVAGVIITGVGLVGVRQRVADLQINQRVVLRLVVILTGPGGIDQLAVGQQPMHGRLQAAVAINRPLAGHQKGHGAEGGAQVQLAAAVGQAKAVFGARVEVALEQHRILILRGVGVALGVQITLALVDVSGQFDVVAVAVVEIQQAVE